MTSFRFISREKDDCTLCAVAMVMRPPYTYERVLADSKKYAWTDSEDGFFLWWKEYLFEGYEVTYSPLRNLKLFSDFASLADDMRALLVFQIPHERRGHIVATDR